MSSENSEPAIHAFELGKSYQIFSKQEDRLKDFLFGRWKRYHTDFWALRNINIDIPRGVTAGIVGRNGSGKSTLLQMICGIGQPSEGTLKVNGRIAALLELGAGFNPAFTGRENVFLNAAILGLDRAMIAERYQSIVDFADIGDFINAPVKTYSSGMFARLAFAVAINVDPDILVVDEALSVGDEAFQRRCFNRIQNIRDSGATILFVSHSLGSVVDLCDTAYLLDQGELLMVGKPKKVVAEYRKLLYAPPDQVAGLRSIIKAGEKTEAPTQQTPARHQEAGPAGEDYFEEGLVSKSAVPTPPNGARIVESHFVDANDRRVNVLLPDRVYRFQFRIAFERPAYNVRPGLHIKILSGSGLGGMLSHAHGQGIPFVDADTEIWASFEFRPALTAGTYFLDASAHCASSLGGQDLLHMVDDIDVFRIDPIANDVTTGFVRFGTENGFTYWIAEADEADATPPENIVGDL